MLAVDVAHRQGHFSLAAAFESAAGVTALFGRSGSGKTTIVNAIAGVFRPQRGRIVLDERVLLDTDRGTSVPARERRIGYVFQDARLFPHLTVRQNLRYGRWFTAEAERYVEFDRTVSLLGLEALLDRRPGRLSGGEKQRVAIGRALLASPRLLLMDEPLASLDAHRKAEILSYIERLRDEVRVPIVMVSHHLEDVVRLADAIVVVSDGGVVAAGPTQAILNRADLRPHTGRYEAGAVIDARVVRHDLAYDIATLAFSGGELRATGIEALPGERIRVRIRARDVSIARAPPADISVLNVIPGTVRALRPVDDSGVEVELDCAGTPLFARITRYSAESLRLAPGLPVYALVKALALDRRAVGYA